MYQIKFRDNGRTKYARLKSGEKCNFPKRQQARQYIRHRSLAWVVDDLRILHPDGIVSRWIPRPVDRHVKRTSWRLSR